METPASSLSGGNQQKVVLSKWLDTKPRILILDEPTRGIDVGAKVEVHQLVDELVQEGIAIILISSDLPELLPMSDRILVMREGRQMAIVDGDVATQEEVLARPWARPSRCAEIAETGVTDSILRRLRPTQLRELILVLIIVGLVIFFSTQIDSYLTGRTFNRVTTEFPIVAIVAVGQVLVVLTRNIDLSVGSQVGLVAYASTGSLAHARTQRPRPGRRSVAHRGMGMGVVMGGINGVIVAYGRVPAIITTLATLAIYRSSSSPSAGRGPSRRGLPRLAGELPRRHPARSRRLRYPPHLVRRPRRGGGGPAGADATCPMAGGCTPSARIPTRPPSRAARAAGRLPCVLGCGALAGLGGFVFMAKFGNITVARRKASSSRSSLRSWSVVSTSSAAPAR